MQSRFGDRYQQVAVISSQCYCWYAFGVG